jgi:hypothetical protein
MIDQVSQFAASFPPQSVLLFEQSDAGNRVTAPLWLIFDRTAFMITDEAMSDPALAKAVETWQSDGRDVYWISTQGQTPAYLAGLVANHLSTHVLAAPLVENPVGRLPQKVGEYAATLDVHRVVAAPSVLERKTVLTLNPGLGKHDQYVSEGLYDLKRLPGLTGTRWTSGRVSLAVPVTGRPTEVMLRIADGRPWSAPVPKVSIYLADYWLGTVRVKGAFDTYSVSVPKETWQNNVETVELRLEMETWNPLQAGYNQDPRDLGVLLDWVKIVLVETVVH